jgi:hypothetical protein
LIRYKFVAAGNRSLNAPCALASAALRTVSPSALKRRAAARPLLA